MSQWNNSYAYNNQYQGPNTWNGDPNNQFVNQTYYRPENNTQYVNFNEFLNQMQGDNVAPSTSNYNRQYENYPSNEYSYQHIPPSQPQATYNYSAPPNAPSEQNYLVNSQDQYNALRENNCTNEIIFKSNLTPTAMEFVPKSSIAGSSSSQNIPETSNEKENIHERPESHTTSSRNWRERPQSLKTESKDKPVTNGYAHDSYRSYGNSRRDNRDTNRINNAHSENNQQTENSRNTDVGNAEEATNYQEPRPGNYQESRQSNYQEPRSSNYQGPRSSNYQDSRQSNYQDPRQSNFQEPKQSNFQEPRSSNYQEPRSSNYQDSRADTNRSYDNNRNDRRNQTKGKPKPKEDNRTFYNSTISKDSQDVRSGKGDSRRSWAGSQRLRGSDRYNVDDEQYANNYLQQKEDKAKAVSSPSRFKKKQDQVKEVNKEMTQRERLTEQLDKGTLECLVCCDRVKQIDPVWWCSNCYHVLHLKCIRKWAMSSTVEGKWRCPACQNTNETIPSEYRCMCGAVRSPEYVRGSGGAHTCGRACRRARSCPHPCTLLCHPGPCPPCQATVNKQCGCGAETRSVLCSSKLAQVCGRVCGRTLACQQHKCEKDCHEGPCDDCDKTITQVCYCPASSGREVPCGSGEQWSCGRACGRVLACGQHVCRTPCHAPPCAPCTLLPQYVITCPCGKNKLEKDQRKNCTDPIPLCGNICAKPLPCGPDGDKHFCKHDCHEGSCPECPDTTLVQCRCGHSSREVPCVELPELLGNVLCQKKCNKKLSCGRHRCRVVCCSATSHRCAVVCGRMLSCGLHRCEEFCHTGHCAPCSRLGFTEVSCACGAARLLPPVACGARPPACSAPCRAPRPCSHEPHHACHPGECPPCVVLTAKTCHGQHEERKTIPCSQEDFSCGRPCGKPLPCGKHTCIKTCHKGPCDTSKCTQPCQEKRPSCGHECAAACHAGGGGGTGGTGGGSACPSAAPCRRLVRATCPCARRHQDRTCSDNARDYAKMMSALAATKMQEGGSVDLSEVQRPGNMLKTLECDDSCRQEARARQLALALQIRNPDVSAKLAPRYSDMLRTTAAREPAFANMVHDKLTDLVQLAKKSKQKTRSHSFPSMNRQKRQFIHELCEHFGCESVAYDAEPNRNVVATADKEKSWLPAMSVLEVLGREAGKRRVPGPVLRAPPPPAANTSIARATTANNNKSPGGWATLTSTNAWAARSQAKPQTQSQPQPQTKIDYFDNPPDN